MVQFFVNREVIKEEKEKLLALFPDPKERKYLELIMQKGARVLMTDQIRKKRRFQKYREFVRLLSALYENGLIPFLEIVKEPLQEP